MDAALNYAKKILRMQTVRWLIVGLLVGAFAATAIYLFTANQTTTPTDTSADAGFARDMGDHHQQAVDMAFIIRERSNDEAVRSLAFDIINTQATQRGMMMGWLEQWRLPQTTSRPALAWMNNKMDHSSMQTSGEHSGLMPGMASPEEIDKLKSLSGKEAEILFMQMMIRHHTGGITMAKGLLESSNRPEVRTLAQSIVNGQQAEIELLTRMLKDRGAQP